MLEPGSQVQNAIYLAGGAEWPVSPEDWEAGARERLEQGPFDYVAGGAGLGGDGPGQPRGVRAATPAAADAHRQRRTRSLGRGARAALAGAVRCSARSACSRSCIPRPSSASRAPRRRPACRWCSPAPRRRSLEDVAAELGDAQRWFQLYWWGDRELAGSLVDRAGAAGYGAIVVTLDTLTLGWRERDLGSGYLPLPAGRWAGAVLQRPALPRAAGRAAGGGPADGVADGARRVPQPAPHLGDLACCAS